VNLFSRLLPTILYPPKIAIEIRNIPRKVGVFPTRAGAKPVFLSEDRTNIIKNDDF
jgi:hypothetical protein